MQTRPVGRNLTIGIAFSVLLLAGLSVGSFLLTEKMIRENTAGTSLVNVSGHQRLLSRHIAELARQILTTRQTGNDEILRGNLSTAIDLMEQAHSAVVSGDPKFNVPVAMSGEVRTLYFGPDGVLDRDLNAYISHARSFLHADRDTLVPDNADYLYITGVSADKLLNALDTAARRYQNESDQRSMVLSRIHFFTLISTLLLLLFLGPGIFHPMIRRIRREFDERQLVEDELREKAALIELLHRTATQSNQATEPDEATRTCIHALCKYKNWPLGHAYILDPDSQNRLLPTNIWYAEDTSRFKVFQDMTKKTTFEPGVGLPGRVLASRQPAWIVDVTKDRNFPRARGVEGIDIKGAFALPVLISSKVVAVLEFFSSEAEEPDQALLRTLIHVGTQLGSAIERLQTADALRHSERRKSRILESSLDAIVTIDRNGRVIEFNPAAESIFKYRNEEVTGKNIADLIIPDQFREKHQKGIQNYLASGRPRLMGRRIELTAVRSDHSEFPIELSITTIDTGDDLVFTAFLRDITKRKTAETELRRSEERYAMAIEAGRVGVWDLDMNTGEMYLAPQLKRLLGYGISDIDDSIAGWAGVVHPEDFQPISRKLSNCWKGWEQDFLVEHRILHRDGSTRWFLLRGTLSIDSDGKPLRITGTETDITERVHAEENSRKHRALLAHARRVSTLGEMATGLAHELNQPLTAATTYLGGALRQLRSREQVTVETVEAIDRALKQTLRAGDIIRWLRSFVRKEKADLSAVDVQEALSMVLGLAQARIRKSGIRVDLRMEHALPRVLAEPIQVEQLLLNLIWNAADAIEASTLSDQVIRIHARKHDELHIKVTIANTGPVIEKEQLTRIFDPFFTTKSEGMGLGLSICRSIVENLQGRLWAESDEATGTAFKFTLPNSREPPHAEP